MNVIISNQNDEMLSSLNIEVIKKLKGSYSVEEIISMFENFFYEKMIIDVTAIKDYKDIANMQKLSISLDASKIILLLDSSADTSAPGYISGLISLGIFNFTKNIDGVTYLLSHTNTYKDVASMHNMSGPVGVAAVKSNNVRTIGVKNLTEHAGASTFVYIMKKELEKSCRVAAVEVDKKDFVYFNDRNMVSTTKDGLGEEMIKLSSNFDILLVDLNNSSNEKVCADIIYLMEPSVIKINKFVAKNREMFKVLDGKKIVLNKCMLSPKDVGEFEMEAGIRAYYVMPPVNDRQPNDTMKNFLIKLGLLSKTSAPGTEVSNPVSGSGGLLNLFRHRG